MSDPFDPPPEPAQRPPASWQEMAAEFVDSRLELFRLEAKTASREAAQRAALVAIISVAVALTWILLLAGLIGLIAHAQEAIPWYGLTLIAALLHLIVAIAAVARLRQPGTPSFPLTRNELAKDREWLQRLKNTPPKSKP